ncbi:hypothetical protein V5O48_010341 [Marasmius crinis-equi]|uniref:Flocculation protein FLO11 n=1 Tax=Marasmius crinis-equi TaxID=585013 RepID=A0ABR3F8P6_9AGAR
MPAVPVQQLNGHGKENTEEESPLTLAHLTPKPKPKSCVLVDSPKRNSPSKTQTQKRKRVLFEEDDAAADGDVDVEIGGNDKMIDLTQSADDEDEIRYHDTMQTPLLSMKGEHSVLMNVSVDMDMTPDSMEVDLNTELAGRWMMYSRELGLGGSEESKPVLQSKKQEEKPTKTLSTKPVFPKPPGSTKSKTEDQPRSKNSAVRKPESSASKPKRNFPSTQPPKPTPVKHSNASSVPPADTANGVEPPKNRQRLHWLGLYLNPLRRRRVWIPPLRLQCPLSLVTPSSSPSTISSARSPSAVTIQAAPAPSTNDYAVGSSLPFLSPPPEQRVASPTIALPPRASTSVPPSGFLASSLSTQVIPSSSDTDSVLRLLYHLKSIICIAVKPSSSSADHTSTELKSRSQSKSAVSTDKSSSSTLANTSNPKEMGKRGALQLSSEPESTVTTVKHPSSSKAKPKPHMKDVDSKKGRKMATTSRAVSFSQSAAVVPPLRRAASLLKAKAGVTAPTTSTASTSKPSLPSSSCSTTAPATTSSVPSLEEEKESQTHNVRVDVEEQCPSLVEEQDLPSEAAVTSSGRTEVDVALAADEMVVEETLGPLSLAITTVATAGTSSTSSDDVPSSPPAAISSTTPIPLEHPDDNTEADAATPTAPVGHVSKPTKTSGAANPKSKVVEKAKKPPRTKPRLPPAKTKEKCAPGTGPSRVSATVPNKLTTNLIPSSSVSSSEKHDVYVDVEEQASSSLTTPAQAAVTFLTTTEADTVPAIDDVEVFPLEGKTPGPCFMISDDVPSSLAATSSTTPGTAAPASGVDLIPHISKPETESSSAAVIQKAHLATAKGKAPVVVGKGPPRKKPRVPAAPVLLLVKEKRTQRVASAPAPGKVKPRAPVDRKGKEKESALQKVDERIEETIAVATAANASTTQNNNNNGVEFTFCSPPPESSAANDASTSTPPLASTFEGSYTSQQLPTSNDEMLTVSQLSPQKPVST